MFYCISYVICKWKCTVSDALWQNKSWQFDCTEGGYCFIPK